MCCCSAPSDRDEGEDGKKKADDTQSCCRSSAATNEAALRIAPPSLCLGVFVESGVSGVGHALDESASALTDKRCDGNRRNDLPTDNAFEN